MITLLQFTATLIGVSAPTRRISMRATPRTIFLKSDTAQDRLVRASFNELKARLNARKLAAARTAARTAAVVR
jgi:hypothetical protein